MSSTPLPFRIIAWGDVHIPFHDPKAVAAALAHLRATHVDAFVQVGDCMDFDMLGSFVEGRPGLLLDRELLKDFEDAKKFWHKEVALAARAKNKKCSLWYLEGNHEERIEREYNCHPHYRGLLDIERNLALKEIGCTYVRADSKGDVLRFEVQGSKVVPAVRNESQRLKHWAVSFIHGWYHSAHFAKKTAERFPTLGPIVQGDTHTIQVYMAEQWGPDSPHAMSIGFLGRKELAYRKGRPGRWEHAVAEFTIAGEGHYSYSIHPIRDGRLVANGRIYGQ